MTFKRKQIYLDPASDRTLKKLAQATGLSEAEHIRRAVEGYINQQKLAAGDDATDPFLQLVGICDNSRGPKDAARRHDRYLYGRRS